MDKPTVERPKQVDSYRHDKQRILARLRRMEGQVRGVQRMVEEDQYCVEILTQLSSIMAAARSIGLLLLEDHIRGCVLTAEDKEAKIQELTEAIDRFTKSVG
ncbi:MAG: metal-sensitive transcriptional regulator [Sphaerobacter sp.]|nr:metal-sensitive transcriptional regulator [Sphaerobacter sp.]